MKSPLLFLLLGLFVSTCTTSPAQCIQLEVSLDETQPLSQDIHGANNECLFRPVWFDHPAYTQKYMAAGRPFFRYPGGTGSNFYNPFTGFYVPYNVYVRSYFNRYYYSGVPTPGATSTRSPYWPVGAPSPGSRALTSAGARDPYWPIGARR